LAEEYLHDRDLAVAMDVEDYDQVERIMLRLRSFMLDG
jgi:hypothetical protein